MGNQNPYPVPVSRKITIRNLSIGSGLPVVIQSMANTPTTDLPASVEQFEKIAAAGGAMIRFTTPTMKDADALGKIVSAVLSTYPDIPVVADVHFRSAIAKAVAPLVDKVRINPGNFTGVKKSGHPEDTRKALEELLNICSRESTALRIGVNHGSLSQGMVEKYGDTPLGMVESALEYLEICREKEFGEVVVSLKSSNTALMVKSVRLLVMRMLKEDVYFPLHLGVTEAGDGPEGRIRSVMGVAPLLMEGMGDTIRVSLTEPPENEIPVAKKIVTLFPRPTQLPYNPLEKNIIDPFDFNMPETREVFGVGGGKPVVVVGKEIIEEQPGPDITFGEREGNTFLVHGDHELMIHDDQQAENPAARRITIDTAPESAAIVNEKILWILDGSTDHPVDLKHWLLKYYSAGGQNPVILGKKYDESDSELFLLKAAGEYSLLLIDRFLSGIWIENDHMTPEFNCRLSFQILQASRNRFTSTEYIACPSCGRTLFDIQSVLSEVKAATSHLKGLTIAVMGCIVNGPGEMADADYGYIGAGKNLVSIFKGKKEVLKNVPQESAVDALIGIIKENGEWQDP